MHVRSVIKARGETPQLDILYFFWYVNEVQKATHRVQWPVDTHFVEMDSRRKKRFVVNH